MKKMIKRISVTTIATVWLFISFMLLFGANGDAYIDPSVMTYVIQAVAAVVIAGGATIGIIIRKTRKKINNKLGIDENKNKEVESNEVFISSNDKKE